MRKVLSNFWVVLVSVVLVSYGQMLWMQPWEDDNALFFKLAHIQEAVGFFGKGPLGSGVYKYGAVPFIPIYKLFGFSTPYYFALLILLYFIATLAVYKTFSLVIGKKGGKVASFLFAAGYITSDSFWRMANSATTSITIVMICLFFSLYWQYYKKKKLVWYFGAFVTFAFSLHVAISRTHYLFLVALAFELIFFAFKKFPKSLIYSLIRIAPFLWVFNKLLLMGDSRSSVVKEYILGFLGGQFHLSWGMLSSLSYLAIPDWLLDGLLGSLKNQLLNAILFFCIFLFTGGAILWKRKDKKLTLPLYATLLTVWFFVAKKIYSTPLLGTGSTIWLIGGIGGALLILCGVIFLALKKDKALFLFLLSWLLSNMAAYSAYYPTVAYGTINRYLAHSFFAYVGILGLLFTNITKNKKTAFLGMFVILLGIGNLVHAVGYQSKILATRSLPVKNFYLELKKLLPNINKGDVLYFDIASERQGNYRDATAAAMMPDTGSFAWRYGIDRYDFFLITDFNELIKVCKENNIPTSHIHAFWYSSDGLSDVTSNVQKYFSDEIGSYRPEVGLPTKSELNILKTEGKTQWSDSDIEVNFDKPLTSSYPFEIDLTLTAVPATLSNDNFPITSLGSTNSTVDTPWNNSQMQNKVLGYKAFRDSYYNQVNVATSSEWQDRIKKNLADNDPTTMWQSDRTLWTSETTYLQVQIPKITISGVQWLGASRYNFPTKYTIAVSDDGISWKTVANVDNIYADTQSEQNITFKSTEARYVRMIIDTTLGEDSPQVSEFIVIPEEYENLDIHESQNFMDDPFMYVANLSNFNERLLGLKREGTVQLYWWGDKDNKWSTLPTAKVSVSYDASSRTYSFRIPAGGTQINRLKLSDFNIPGMVELNDIFIRVNSNSVE